MLERLSWKTLALELALFCLPALLLGGVYWLSPLVIAGFSGRRADVELL